MPGIPDFDKMIHEYGSIILPSLIAVAVAVTVSIWYFATQGIPGARADRNNTASQESQNIVFSCAAGKSLTARVSQSAARIKLSDGREMILPRAGGAYANADGSFVFSQTGNTAGLKENGVETYTACKGS